MTSAHQTAGFKAKLPLKLTLSEIAALVMSREFLAPLGASLLGPAVATAFDKIVGVLSRDAVGLLERMRATIGVRAVGAKLQLPAADHLPTIQTGLLERRTLRVRYYSLQAAIENGGVTEMEIADPAEILLYNEFRSFLGDGKSASLAVAVSRRRVIAADEKGRLWRELFDRLGENYPLDTLGAILTAIKADVITAAEADALRSQLREHRFEISTTLFDELLREE